MLEAKTYSQTDIFSEVRLLDLAWSTYNTQLLAIRLVVWLLQYVNDMSPQENFWFEIAFGAV